MGIVRRSSRPARSTGVPVAPPESRVVQVTFAVDAAESVLDVLDEVVPHDGRAREAIAVARAWARGEATAEQAREAEVAARALARELGVPGIATAENAAARAAASAAGTVRTSSESTRALAHAVSARQLPRLADARRSAGA